MTTLKDIICSSENRSKVVGDTVQLVDREVSGKSGLSGLAIKAGYGAVKKIKPGLVREAVDALLERWVDKLEPFYKDWVDGGKSGGFDSFLAGRQREVANALLSVTDERARNVSQRTIKKTYEKLRPQGEKNVIAAVPGLGRVLGKYVSKA